MWSSCDRAAAVDGAPVTAAVATGSVLRPGWRSGRLWVVLGVLIVLGAAAVAVLGRLQSPPGGYLDPRSPGKDGARALARLLAARGAPSTTTTSLDAVTGAAATATVVVTVPGAWSGAELRRLAGRHRLVLVAPATAQLSALRPGTGVTGTDDGPSTVAAGCPDAGPHAAGLVRFSTGTLRYRDAGCYGGRVIDADRIVALGDATLPANRLLAGAGRAALAVNLVGGNGAAGSVVWLRAGVSTGRAGPSGSVADLFPGWAPRAGLWLALVALLAVFWRGRRLGPPVIEDLPVVVRSVEVVEGRGRLYARARAHDRAAAVLRAAARDRLAARLRLRLGRGAGPGQVIPATAAALDPREGWDIRRIAAVLDGPAPVDDAELTALAEALDDLVGTVSHRLGPTPPTWPTHPPMPSGDSRS